MNYLTIQSPVGPLTLFEEDRRLISIKFTSKSCGHSSVLLKQVQCQLKEYFAGIRKTFSIPTHPKGTSFQKRIWSSISLIPSGQIQTYGQLAKKCNTSPRAIGHACRTNPIPIIVPCHRILGIKNELKGYSGGEGIKTKLQLLRIEEYKMS